MCLRHMGREKQADVAFRKVISSEKELVADHYLVPYASYELAISQWSQNNLDAAFTILENAK